MILLRAKAAAALALLNDQDPDPPTVWMPLERRKRGAGDCLDVAAATTNKHAKKKAEQIHVPKLLLSCMKTRKEEQTEILLYLHNTVHITLNYHSISILIPS